MPPSIMPIINDLTHELLINKRRQLIVIYPNNEAEIHVLQGTEIRLGRFKPNVNADSGDYVTIRETEKFVSNKHATLEWDKTQQTYVIRDGQDNQTSANGTWINGTRLKDNNTHPLKHKDKIEVKPTTGTGSITMIYRDPKVIVNNFGPTFLKEDNTLGSSNVLVAKIDDPLVDAEHAKITQQGQQYYITALGITYLNGKRIPLNESMPLNEGDEFIIGAIIFGYEKGQIKVAGRETEPIRIEAITLKQEGRLDNITLVIPPKSFVAFVGVSGSGKTSLLKALSGINRVAGTVYFNKDNLYHMFNKYHRKIGYVPQDDIVHETLTIEEALTYVGCLRLPNLSHEVIQLRVKSIVENVKLKDVSEKNKLISEISGGQRKRVNIAMELLAECPVIFLDEPTSSLDPDLDTAIIKILMSFAEAGQTIILVTHNVTNINNCNYVAVLGEGGKLLFYGEPKNAPTFFGVHGFIDIYGEITNSEKWAKQFEVHANTQEYKDFIQELRKLDDDNKSITLTGGQPTITSGGDTTVAIKKTTNQSQWPLFPLSSVNEATRQWWILVNRYFKIYWRSINLLMFFALTIPFIVAPGLMWFILPNNLFHLPVDIPVLVNRLAIIIIMAILATFSVLNAVEEIAKEKKIYERERLAGLSAAGYLLSKFFVLSSIGIFQTLVMVGVIGYHVKFGSDNGIFGTLYRYIGIGITIWLMILAAQAWGLLISTLFKVEQGVKITIGFLIFQVLLAGFMFDVKDLIPNILSKLTITRWGFEAMGGILEFNPGPYQGNPPFYLTFEPSGWVILGKWFALVCHSIIMLFFAWFVLRVQEWRSFRKQA